MMELNTLQSALASHLYLVVFFICVNTLVLTGQMPAMKSQWERLPAIARPFVPIVLGTLSGVAQAGIAQTSLAFALISNIGLALPAVALAIPSQVIRRDPVTPETPPGA
jgi:hypothetical protein